MSASTTIEWAPVPTHVGYWASRCGDVKGPRGRILRPMMTDAGYRYVLTPLPRRPRKLFVHRAVLLAFIGPPPPGCEAIHSDGNPANNRLSNLSWGTHLQNMADMIRHGTGKRGEEKVGHRLTWVQVSEIRLDPRSARRVGRDYGVSHTTILTIRRGSKWKVSA